MTHYVRRIDLSNATWRKSTHSDGGGECVEAAFLPDDHVAVRHSRRPDNGPLIYTPGEWRAFVQGVKDGEFDLS